MNRGPTFKLLGIPVRIELTFLLTTVFLGLERIENRPGNAVFWFAEVLAVVAVSILLHEYGHAYAYKKYGQKPAIVLWGLGGLAYGEADLPPKKRIVVSLAGPFAELLLLGIPAYIVRAMVTPNYTYDNQILYYILSDIIVLNIFWAIVNLLPILPLDGGNVADAALELYHDEPRTQTVRLISMITAVVLTLYAWRYWGFGFAVIFGAVLFVINLIPYLKVRNGDQVLGGFSMQSLLPGRPGDDEGGGGSRENVLSLEKARKKRDRRSPAEMVDEGFEALERRDYKDALRIADRLRGKRLNGELDRSTAELAAFAWIGEHNPLQAEATLAEHKKGSPSRPLAAVLAIANKQTDAGVVLMVNTMVDEPEGGPKLVAVDLFAEYGMIHRLARELVDLDGGSGFEAAVALESMLHRLHRTQDASTVSDVILLG